LADGQVMMLFVKVHELEQLASFVRYQKLKSFPYCPAPLYSVQLRRRTRPVVRPQMEVSPQLSVQTHSRRDADASKDAYVPSWLLS
jgi:hypothetical protein